MAHTTPISLLNYWPLSCCLELLQERGCLGYCPWHIELLVNCGSFPVIPPVHYHEMCSTNNRVDLATSAQTDRFAFAIDLIQHLDLSWLSLFKWMKINSKACLWNYVIYVRRARPARVSSTKLVLSPHGILFLIMTYGCLFKWVKEQSKNCTIFMQTLM